MQKPVPSLLPLSFNIRIIFIILCCIALNVNTINHEYALDDNIVIGKNMNVNKGFDGIGKILGTDAFQGFLDYAGANMPIAGGRYRPLSIVSFAIETSLFTNALGGDYLDAKKEFTNLQAAGASKEQVEAAAQKVKTIDQEIDAQNLAIAPVRHGFQIAWFTLSMVVLFIFLSRYLLPQQPDVALITTLLFIFHPIHTEVIANIKSRDEIFSLLFITLSCMYVFRYIQSNKTSDLLLLLLFTLLAMLSKEYAIVLPAIAFAAVYLTQKTEPKKIIMSRWFMLMLAVIAVMMLVRYNIVIRNRKVSTVTDVLNDPFMYASLQQKIATKIAILNEYLKLLVFPYPLSSDYSYNHYPYLTFANWQVWLSLAVWAGIIYITVKLWQKRHFLAFPLVFFFAFFMLVNNLLFGIGATMGERLVYHSSLGFCMIVAWLFVHKTPVVKNRSAVIYGLIILLLVPMTAKTISRNADWKNDYTLFTRDVKYVPNSALANGNAGAQWYNKAYKEIRSKSSPTHADTLIFMAHADTARMFLTNAVNIHQHYVNSYGNRALCYITLGKTDSAIADWKMAATNFKGRLSQLIEHAVFVMELGKNAGNQKDYATASRYLRDASVMDPANPEIWHNLGGAEYMQGNFYEAMYAFNQALSISPGYQDAAQGSQAASNYVALLDRCRKDSTNITGWLELARILKANNFDSKSKETYKKVLTLDPGNTEAKTAVSRQ